MPHPEEKKRRLLHSTETVVASDDFLARFDALGVDVLANIYGFLRLDHVVCLRRINKKSREAVKMTLVPLTPLCFGVESVEDYEDMSVMMRAIPNLQQIEIGRLRYRHRDRHKYNDGEDPDEELAAATAHYTAHDIEIISNFSKLSELAISYAPLNGRYPFLFNSFPLLQKLSIEHCECLKWDLEMLAGFPLLKELECHYNRGVTGNLSSLRVLKDTLEKLKIESCENIDTSEGAEFRGYCCNRRHPGHW